MTKILLIILAIFAFNMNKSQTLDITPNASNFNSNINKFVGTWIWTNGTESLVLIFKKENILLPLEGNIRADVLYGFHQYKVNNIVIESSTQYSNSNYTNKNGTLLGSSFDNPNELSGSFQHTTKNKSVRFEIQYIDTNHIKLVKLENYEGIRVNIAGKPPYDSAISLPQNITLTKQ